MDFYLQVFGFLNFSSTSQVLPFIHPYSGSCDKMCKPPFFSGGHLVFIFCVFHSELWYTNQALSFYIHIVVIVSKFVNRHFVAAATLDLK